MLIVADSSALVALATCRALALLAELYDDVKVPPAVYDELIVAGKPQAEQLAKFLSGHVVDVDTARFVVTAGGLGQGEVEAMALYKSLAADYLLIDDRRARIIAEANEIRCIGALGVLLLAKHKNLINKVAPYIEILKQSPLHYSELLLARVLQLVDEPTLEEE